ncbi:MAG: hypothetical protein QNJ13_16195 [Paracoccaceae bacterium]|nr:hypothetical protein [Paracoccaceae bacterium]
MRKTLILVLGGAFAATMASAATLEEMDANADGMVTFDELLVVMPDVTEEAFTLADANQDGMIDAGEFSTAQDSGILPAS